MTIQTWLNQATKILKDAGIASARLDCLVILEQSLDVERSWILAHNDTTLAPQQIVQLSNKIDRRKNRTPLAYITGSKEFYGRTFAVNEDVLIPRPESEAIFEHIKTITRLHAVNTILDIGTGSGILAITVKKELPNAHVTGVDISEAALTTARKNARLHEAQVQFKLCDITKELPAVPRTRPYIVVANLPYVPESLITSPEITKEPALALFSGANGMDHYKSLWSHIGQSNHKPLAVIAESLKNQHSAMRDIAEHNNYSLVKSTQLIQTFCPNLV